MLPPPCSATWRSLGAGLRMALENEQPFDVRQDLSAVHVDEQPFAVVIRFRFLVVFPDVGDQIIQNVLYLPAFNTTKDEENSESALFGYEVTE